MRKSFVWEEMGEEKFLLGGNMLGKGSFGRKWVSKSSYCGEMDEEKFLLRGNGEEKFLVMVPVTRGPVFNGLEASSPNMCVTSEFPTCPRFGVAI